MMPLSTIELLINKNADKSLRSLDVEVHPPPKESSKPRQLKEEYHDSRICFKSFPAEAQVILYAVSSGNVQGYKEIDRTYTGRDGLFHFLAVPPGRYIIQVEGRNYPVEVTDPNQEVGPVKIELNASGVP
jgi:hypothetical protein